MVALPTVGRTACAEQFQTAGTEFEGDIGYERSTDYNKGVSTCFLKTPKLPARGSGGGGGSCLVWELGGESLFLRLLAAT